MWAEGGISKTNNEMQKRRTIHILQAILLLLASTLVACQNENISDIDDNAKTGRIVLNLQNVEVFTEVTTRAEQAGNVSDYTYTLSGTTQNGTAVTDQTVTFTEGSAIIPAGTYTLTATSTTAQDVAPWYQGTSTEFTLGVGGTESVSIDLGKPKNAAITVSFDASFTNLYENYSVTIGQHSVPDDSSSGSTTLYAMPGTITYTIKGSAQAGTHVSDIPEAGITGTLTVVAGTSYPLNINAQSITDLMMGIGSGTHNGPFDAKRK